MKRRLLNLYLIVIHILLVWMVVKSDFLRRARDVLVPPEVAMHSQHYQVMRRIHRSIDGVVPPGSVLFVGDSLVQGLLGTRVHNKAVNLGIGTDTTEGVIARLETYASTVDAAAVVFAVGLNDLFVDKRSVSEILKNYRAMESLVPIEIPVVFSAVLPVADPLDGRHFNPTIRQVNAELKLFCQEQDRLFFSDPTDRMTDKTGNLDRRFHSGDGVHLSARGNEIWITQLKDTLSDALVPGRSWN